MIKKQVDTGLFIRSIGVSATSTGALDKATALKQLAKEYPYSEGWEVIGREYIPPRTPQETEMGLYTFALLLGKYEYVAE